MLILLLLNRDRFKRISEQNYDENDTSVFPEKNTANSHEEEEDASLDTNINRNSRSELKGSNFNIKL